MLLTDVRIRGERALGQGCIQYHTVVGPDDVLKDRVGQIRGRCRRSEQTNHDRIAAGCGLRLDQMFIRLRENQKTAFGAGASLAATPISIGPCSV